MKKLIAVGVVIGIAMLVSSNLGGPVARAEAKVGATIDVVVPDQILVVWEAREDTHPAKDLVAGLKEVAKSYRIIRTEGIVQKVDHGGQSAAGTEALLVYVEPKR